MIRKYLPYLILLLAAPALFAEGEAKFGEADFQTAAKSFMADPIQNSKPQCAAIFGFASESPDVSVLISEKTGILWVNEKAPGKDDLKALLLCGYIVGSVESQLKSRKKENDSIAGVKAVLRVYAFLKKKHPTFKLASVEKLAAADKQGKVGELLAGIEEK